jgi:hypothetical protein
MIMDGIDSRTWVSLLVQQTPFGSLVELTPERDRVLRPVEIISLSVMQGDHVLQIKELLDARASSWEATILDGTFSVTVDGPRPDTIYQRATILDDSLHGDAEIASCVRVTPAHLVVATYEHVGRLPEHDARQWIERLELLTTRILAFARVGKISYRSERALFPRLSSFLKKAEAPPKLLSYVDSARWAIDPNAMCEAIRVPVLMMTELGAVHSGPPEEVQEELVCAAEHAALFALRSQQQGDFQLSLGGLARFLVDDRLGKLGKINRGIRLAKHICERGIDIFFEQSALSYILGLCRSSAKRDRDDFIEAADWLIERLRRQPAMTARLAMRLLTKPASPESDSAMQGREILNRVDLIMYLFDIMEDAISKDTSDQISGGTPLTTMECPSELPNPADATRFPAWPPDGAPFMWVHSWAGTKSDIAQRAILGFEILGDSDEVLNLPFEGMYFRAFRQTRRLRIPNQFVPDGSNIIAYPFEPSVLTFEAALHRSLARKVHIFAVAGPHDALGMGRMYMGQTKINDWQARVTMLLGHVQFIVYLPDRTESLIWESNEIYKREMTPHCVFVMMPRSTNESSEAIWNTFRQLETPYCAHLPKYEPDGAFVWFENDLSPKTLPFDALYDRRLSDLIVAISRPKQAAGSASDSSKTSMSCVPVFAAITSRA